MSEVVYLGRQVTKANGKSVRDMRKGKHNIDHRVHKFDNPELAKHNLIHVTSGSINREKHSG